jgi:hypothetical protein
MVGRSNVVVVIFVSFQFGSADEPDGGSEQRERQNRCVEQQLFRVTHVMYRGCADLPGLPLYGHFCLPLADLE